jgi:hypothetical protein
MTTKYVYQTVVSHTKWLLNVPNGHKIFQQCLSQGPPKHTQIWIFCLRIYHLAALVMRDQPADARLAGSLLCM